MGFAIDARRWRHAVVPRTRLYSSPLVRWLASLQVRDVADPRQTMAERLSPWLDWTDAIALSGVLDGAPTQVVGLPGSSRKGAARAASDDLDRVRGELALSITRPTGFDAGAAPAAVATMAAMAAMAAESPGALAGTATLAPVRARRDADAPPWRRHYLSQQQSMQARIGPLRSRVRAALTARSAALARLAALDAVFEQALGEREQHLLATVPALLERHFAPSDPALQLASAPPLPPQQADARRAPEAQRRLMQQLLLAELELRLQPVAGMVDALAGDAAVTA